MEANQLKGAKTPIKKLATAPTPAATVGPAQP
jgi:hypothetical protein